MKYAASLSSAAVALLLLGSHAVNAQTAASSDTAAPTYQTQVTSNSVPTDVQPGSWAYSAVSDLAGKGLIAGYPPDGKFLGGRTITRYEMATIIARILDRLHDLEASGQGASAQSQIDEIRRLTDDYKVELTVIGANMTQAQADIKTLQGDVGTLQAGLNSAYDAIEEQAKKTTAVQAQVKKLGDTDYSSSSTSKFNISGYVQFRMDAADSGSHARYPQGTNATSGAYNGNYAQGGSKSSAEVRRARLKFSGAPTSNVKYAAQIDFSGAIAAGSNAANQQVTVREANLSYTFGDGTSLYPTITAGQFANIFGYVLPLSTANTLTPERPLAFSEGNNLGLFDNQDYDKGIKAAYLYKGVNLAYALVNGAGRGSENIDNHFDSIYRVNYQTVDKQFGIGASYYDGVAVRTRPASLAATTLTYPEPKKQLYGVDAQVTLKNGIFVDGEYVAGKYEKRSYFDENLATAAAPIGADALQTDTYVKNNQVEGYYVWGGYSFNASSPRPLTLAVDYDYFDRSKSAHADPLNAFASGTGNTALSSGTYIDRNIGYGALYNLDKATRLRLWYTHPYDVSHAAGTPDPPKIGLYTAELQVRF